MNSELRQLRDALREFAKEREWEQFHTPKNLSMALAVEVAELMEIFQWLTPEQSRELTPEKRNQLEEELGDTIIYLVRLADVAGVELISAAQKKLAKNRVKYPAEASRGSAKKYDEY